MLKLRKTRRRVLSCRGSDCSARRCQTKVASESNDFDEQLIMGNVRTRCHSTDYDEDEFLVIVDPLTYDEPRCQPRR